MNYLNNFQYKGLWETKEISWNNVNKDVNILVGINGAGKTTLLNLLYKDLSQKKEPVLYIPSVDNIALHDRRRTSTALSQDLDYYVYDLKNGPSFMMKLMSSFGQSSEKQTEINANIQKFLAIVNDYLSLSSKSIAIDGSKLVVKLENDKLSLDILSSGEKYLMLLFLRVFLLDEQSSIVLIDEPENTLHIQWQRELIDTLRSLNPNAQYIITTHSPSLFGKGWGDKVVYVEDIIK